jgi:transposase
MAYDKKFKKRAIEYHEEGNSVRQTSKVFGISPNTLNTWLKQYRRKGELTVKPRVYRSKIKEREMLTYLEENPDAYQSEMAERFGVSQTAISKALKRFKITRKKR